jgi:hypothetical protein
MALTGALVKSVSVASKTEDVMAAWFFLKLSPVDNISPDVKEYSKLFYVRVAAGDEIENGVALRVATRVSEPAGQNNQL